MRNRLAIATALFTLGAGLPAFAGNTPDFTPGELGKLKRALDIKSQRWARLPWQVSLSDALETAASERKPVFMVVNTGNCLGDPQRDKAGLAG